MFLVKLFVFFIIIHVSIYANENEQKSITTDNVVEEKITEEKNAIQHDEFDIKKSQEIIKEKKYQQILENHLYQKKKIRIAVNNFCVPKECRINSNVTTNNASKINVNNQTNEDTIEFFYKRYLYKSMLNSGVSEETASKIIDNVKKIVKVKKLDKSQPETILNFEKYLQIVGFKIVDNKLDSSNIISNIKQKYLENKEVIDTVSDLLRIDKSVLLSIWYNETRCGKITGNFNAIDALYTLALDGRRRDFFEKEFIITAVLIDLKILNLDSKSSWAGAIGNFQTMPSVIYGSYINFSKDKENYEKNFATNLTTGANYLNRIGYSFKIPILFEVKFNKDFDMCKDGGFKNRKKVSDFINLGVEFVDKKLDKKIKIRNEDFLNLNAAIINPDCNIGLCQIDNKEHNNAKFYMVFDNYLSILSWNRSNLYATAVGLIANAILADKDFS